ncbi:MAG: serine hydrolase [Lachnospiraceae bacterium]|nr:serine hydrolase [Lachnospiraceae bacterium]
MKRRYLLLSLVMAGLLMNHTFVIAGESADHDDGGLYDRIEAYLCENVPKTHFPSLSISIVDKDSTLFSKTYGNGGSTDTAYAVGSVSKSFTALCIMQLVEQGKIDLNAPLSDYIPDAKDGDQITILQLLNHTGGLGEYQNLTDYRIVNEQGVHHYANVNYSLLGEVVETVTGKPYEEYARENICEPLNLEHTFTDPVEAKKNGLIDGYENWFGYYIKTKNQYRDEKDIWITIPAGYYSSSSEDLGRYLQMYLRGGENIISPDSIREMFYNSVAVDDEIPYRYGMGWTQINEPLKQPALRHSGLVENGMACIYILPENGIGVAVTVNANDYFVGGDFADRIGWSVIMMLMGDEPDPIGAGEYIMRHLMYDGICLIVFLLSALPLLCMRRYRKNIQKRRPFGIISELIVLHAGLPLFLLLLTFLFMKTPLWVVKAFVPDLFTVIIASACLLFAGGIIKLYYFSVLRKNNMHAREQITG